VLLDDVAVEGTTLTITAPADVDVVFVGVHGRELARARGRSASYDFSGIGAGYVRAVVTDDDGHHAWTQPVRLASPWPRPLRRFAYTIVEPARIVQAWMTRSIVAASDAS
jgi:hypothetical protein